MIKKTTLQQTLFMFLIGALCMVPHTLTAQNPEPELLKDIYPGADDSWGMFIDETAIVNNKLIFSASDGAHGYELWVTDGTLAGTQLLKDINSGAGSSSALQNRQKTVYNGKLYFIAEDGFHGYELWVTDGTGAGTQMVKDITPGLSSTNISQFKEFNGLLFFNANGRFWVTDGTETGTQMVKNINTGNGSSASGFVEYNNKLYFLADDGIHGRELWASDGTQAGTQMIKDINPGLPNSGPWGFTEYNGKLYFRANDGIHGLELWSTDGTEAGTVMVKDINSGIGSSLLFILKEYNGKLYFIADDGLHGYEIWLTDGTEAGTVILKDINPTPGESGTLYLELAEYNGKLIFTADDGVHGRELWSTDGTATGTVMVKDIYPGASGSSPVGLYEYKGKLFFAANDGVHGSELWSTDGTAAGTILLKDILPGVDSGLVHWDFGLTECNGRLYFGGIDSQTGYNLWETDGTEAGTIMLTQPNSTVYNPLLDSFNPVGIVFQDELYFMGNYDMATGIEPYKLTPKPLSIDTPQSKNFAFYPNPTDSHLFITADVLVEKAVVYNLQGQLLITQHFQNTHNHPATIDFSGLSAGVYFVKISGLGWEETHKIVKR